MASNERVGSPMDDRTARLALTGELVGGVVHNLREPLTSLYLNIATAAELLRRLPTPPDVLHALTAATQDGARVEEQLRVLNDLVSSRRAMTTAVSISPLFADIVQLLYPASVVHQCRLFVEIPKRTPPIFGERPMLLAAFLSIAIDGLANARSGARGARLRICARARDTGTITVSFFHHRRPEAAPVDGWRFALPRSVAAAHGATLHIDVDGALRVGVHTEWPAAPA